jgi:hypothetical protein
LPVKKDNVSESERLVSMLVGVEFYVFQWEISDHLKVAFMNRNADGRDSADRRRRLSLHEAPSFERIMGTGTKRMKLG